MKPKHTLLIILTTALVALSAYYYVAFQISSQAQALEIRGTVEALRAGN